MILFQTNTFWVAVLACFLLRERVRLAEIIGIFVCFGGVVMIGFAKQERIDETTSTEEDKDDDDGSTLNSFDQWLGLLLSLLAAWTFSFNAIYNRKLKDMNVNVVMFYYAFLGTVVSLAILFV